MNIMLATTRMVALVALLACACAPVSAGQARAYEGCSPEQIPGSAFLQIEGARGAGRGTPTERYDGAPRVCMLPCDEHSTCAREGDAAGACATVGLWRACLARCGPQGACPAWTHCGWSDDGQSVCLP
jgi:hypothetical protein